MKKLLIAIILFSNPAMATNINGQANKNKAKAMNYTQQDVTVLGDTDTKRMVKAPNAPSMAIVNSNAWPCGGFAGIAAQGQYAGATAGASKDSKNCIAWMLAMQETNEAMKESYLCQLKVHRKARKHYGKPCKKSRR